MAAVLDDVKVVEVAGWTFVPAGGGVLADLRAVNPQIIVARGTGQGVRGEDANRAGFDGSSYFSRGGVAHMLMEQNMEKELGLDRDAIVALKLNNTVN